MDVFPQDGLEVETLQADVMRFLAIIAFSLLIIIIPLIQEVSEKDNTSQSDKGKGAQIDGGSEDQQKSGQSDPAEEKDKAEDSKEDSKPDDSGKKDSEKPEKDSEEKPDDSEESPDQAKDESDEPPPENTRVIKFEQGAFEKLLESKQIKSFVILTKDNMIFETKKSGNNYHFPETKTDLKKVFNKYRLRNSKMPKSLIRSFEQTYSALAGRPKEFYFVPVASDLARNLLGIYQEDKYGQFIIQPDGKLIHEN